jgi:hypothetical protein
MGNRRKTFSKKFYSPIILQSACVNIITGVISIQYPSFGGGSEKVSLSAGRKSKLSEDEQCQHLDMP